MEMKLTVGVKFGDEISAFALLKFELFRIVVFLNITLGPMIFFLFSCLLLLKFAMKFVILKVILKNFNYMINIEVSITIIYFCLNKL